tara:strand:+ start:35 stop:541 length:507 start_codon:yes stop_codon:yes gene_type:complete
MGKYVALALFISTVVGANWALATFGIVPIGFGLTAPAGVFAAGLAFSVRDWMHEVGGRRWVLVAIFLGAFLSWCIEPTFAIASGLAFACSELLDFAIYTPLRRRGWIPAVLASNAAGMVADSALFLSLAFGSLQFIEGQLVGKAYMTIIAIAIVFVFRRIRDISVRIS